MCDCDVTVKYREILPAGKFFAFEKSALAYCIKKKSQIAGLVSIESRRC